METPWDFSYQKLITPQKFNIRPSFIYSNLSIYAGTNKLFGFTYQQLSLLTVGMKITKTTPETVFLFGNRIIDAIDLIELSITVSGSSLAENIVNDSFTFNTLGLFSEPSPERPLTGQELHDNFFYLAQGVTNHQERVSMMENKELTVGSPKVGFVKYNGLLAENGTFYGGKDLVLNASNVFNTTLIFDSSNQTEFFIALNKGITDLNESTLNSFFYKIIFGDDLNPNTTFSNTTDLCAYLNNKLKNFDFISNSVSTYIITGDYATQDWDTFEETPGFVIVFDDDYENKVLVEFSNIDKPTTAEGLVSTLNAKFTNLNINSKIVATYQDIGAGDKRIYLSGITTHTSEIRNTCTITLQDVPTHTFLSDVLKLDTSTPEKKSIFNFQEVIEFIPNPLDTNKISIIGTNPTFKIVLKDGDSPASSLAKIGFNTSEFSGLFVSYHVPFPSATSTILNFGGEFRVSSIYTSLLDATTITTPSLTALTATIATLVSTSIEVSSLKATTLSDCNSITAIEINTTNLTSSGDINITGDLFITNTNKTNENTFYKANLISNSILITADAPLAPSDLKYLVYNGNFGANDIDIAGTLKIHGTLVTPIPGRLYQGTASPTSTTNTLNFDGNFRATTVVGVSSRSFKENIKETVIKALDIVMNTEIIDFNYIGGSESRIGFIAEDTHSLLSTPKHNAIDITNSIGVLLKAVQELYFMIKNKE
jgi:hypothetical protein